jgi:hypothetical protein
MYNKRDFTNQEPALTVGARHIGLTRNPIDTLYSMWCRWRAPPEQQRYEWLRAYQNLARFQSLAKDRLRIIRYEELVSDDDAIKGLCAFVGIEWMSNIGSGLQRYLCKGGVTIECLAFSQREK